MANSPVSVRRTKLRLPTYEPLPPDRNPMFLERRVYQGSTGRVYPLPYYNRIADKPVERDWDLVVIENDFVEVTLMPELGGRIYSARDKSNGYDLFYRQPVIKPALVGLAGPWISGGVEFNWPQHHRPATYMRVDLAFEEEADGSRTVWLGDHDPMERMKGMHGVRLRPDSALIELRMRAYNRTQRTQTFLWWANVATRVHEGYQSFFPQDVSCVADHARRAMSRFPLCDDHYYGVDYGTRARTGIPSQEIPSDFVPPHCLPADKRNPEIPDYAPNDLSWYANIPVPTSYMCIGSNQDFSGGYDHLAKAGLVQVADHHMAPGKKQWTWGNQAFGYAWDRNLTDGGGPYIELMLGVFTDNQPDFSFLQPGETKAWSIYWYPIQKIGPAHQANTTCAVSLTVKHGIAHIGVAVTRTHAKLQVRLECKGRELGTWISPADPSAPISRELRLKSSPSEEDLELIVSSPGEGELLRHRPQLPRPGAALPPPATEPPLPAAVKSNDELYVIGLHLHQYRHATRRPEDYWREALRRDPLDARCNNALGLWHFNRGEFTEAELRFRTAISRLVSRNANPYDGEPLYNLGLTLRHQGRDDEAYDSFHKAVWNQAWQSAGYHALAEIDCVRRHWQTALAHINASLRLNTDNLRARNLLVLILRELGRDQEAAGQLSATLALDRLDGWALLLSGAPLACDTQQRLDIALDHARAGFLHSAIAILEDAQKAPDAGTAPLLHYHSARLYSLSGDKTASRLAAKAAAKASPAYCFPSRLEDLQALLHALQLNPNDSNAHLLAGNLLYDRRRHLEAIHHWEACVKNSPRDSVAWRNLGIAYFNIAKSPAKALRAYGQALQAAPRDSRVLHERDQLWKRLGKKPVLRLRELEARADLVAERDDCSLELCTLWNQTGEHSRALQLLETRRFQPWEGGEGQVLGEYVRTRLILGRKSLAEGAAKEALAHFKAALNPPESLGEARHPLANPGDIQLWLGLAHEAAGDVKAARQCWQAAAGFRGDFRDMSVQAYSELSYYSARALAQLGKTEDARTLLKNLEAHARKLTKQKAKIDYFATSLPTMLLFEDDLQARQKTRALFLQAQAEAGLGRKVHARRHLRLILARDPSHPLAADLLAELSTSS